MKPLKTMLQLILMGILISLCACGGGGGGGSAPSNDNKVITVSKIELDKGMLQPYFESSVTEYSAILAYTTTNIKVRPTFIGGSLSVNGVSVASGSASNLIALEEGNNIIDIIATSADGSNSVSYTLNLTRQTLGEFAQSAFIKASDTGEFDNFGSSLALSGNTLVVGATYHGAEIGVNDNNDNTGNGAVYVFVNENGVWRQQAIIETNSDGNDFFGSAVAIEDDTLVIGAEAEDSNAAGIGGDETNNGLVNSGAAYVYQRQADTWTKQAFLKASSPTKYSNFGSRVAISNNTIAVGAYNEDSGATGINGDQTNVDKPDSGAVYIFTLSNGTWEQEAYIKASNPDTDDGFGYSIALDGDTLVVGAPSEGSNSTGINGDDSNNSALISGAVYVFGRTAGVWQQQAYIKPSNTATDQYFGFSLALQDNTLAVTAPWEDSASKGINGDESSMMAPNSGAVYVFTKNADVWSQQAYIKASNTFRENGFGFGKNSIALSGNRLLVGASGENSRSSGVNGDQDDNAVYAVHDSRIGLYDSIGAAYLFELVQGKWLQIAYIKPSNPNDNIGFGNAVALTDKFIIISAENEKTTGTGINPSQSNFDSFVDDAYGNQGAGAVYVFSEN